MRAIGFTLLAVVFLGPTMQPWYVAWSMVVLATVAEHRLRVLVIVLSCVSSFFGLPGEGKLVTEFGEANPYLIVLASIAIVIVLAIPLFIRVRRALRTTPLPLATGVPAVALAATGLPPADKEPVLAAPRA